LERIAALRDTEERAYYNRIETPPHPRFRAIRLPRRSFGNSEFGPL